jgi:hypothetical protein
LPGSRALTLERRWRVKQSLSAGPSRIIEIKSIAWVLGNSSKSDVSVSPALMHFRDSAGLVGSLHIRGTEVRFASHALVTCGSERDLFEAPKERGQDLGDASELIDWLLVTSPIRRTVILCDAQKSFSSSPATPKARSATGLSAELRRRRAKPCGSSRASSPSTAHCGILSSTNRAAASFAT